MAHPFPSQLLLGLALVTVAAAIADAQSAQPARAQSKTQDSTAATSAPASVPAISTGPSPDVTKLATPPPAKAEPFAILRSQPAADLRLNMVRTAPEQIGQVPGHFFWIRKGLQAVQDPVDGNIVFIDDEGRVLGRAALPNGFIINEIIPGAKDIGLVDAGRHQVTIPRTIDPALAGALQAASPARGATRTPRVTRRSNEELLYQDQRRVGSRALSVRALAGGMVAQAYEIGSGTDDKRYIVSEEIAGVTPALKVRVFVQRFDKAGRLTGIVHVPLDGMDSVPRDFITITGDGHARILFPDDSGVKINEIEFAPPPQAGKRLTDGEAKGLGRLLRTTPVESNVTGEKKSLVPRERPPLEITARLPQITRDKILENARAFLTVNWMLRRENFSKAGVDNACEPERGRFWRRPNIFTEAMIGTTIGPMPYRWGGDDTPDSFRVRTQLGALAGDICTCRSATYNYCLVATSAGVDCSGLVSRAWGIEKRGTSGLLDVSDNVASIAALKPGDAFDWSGHHIRLLSAAVPGAVLTFTVIESTTRRDCEGVCERNYRPSELNGFQLIRYRGITDASNVAAKR